jgi:DNA-directed RNA polymerase subunit M/transcription elongation factor TFIIS
MLTTAMDNRARSGMACSECNDLLVAPKSSAYVSNHEVRHVWSCENCGHEIEMAVMLRFDAMSERSVSAISLSVARPKTQSIRRRPVKISEEIVDM